MKTKTKIILEKLKCRDTYSPAWDPCLIIETVKELEKKLLQVEKYLNLGGFIADKNGKPCKDGDIVRFPRLQTMEQGPLHFDHVMRTFTVKEHDGEYWALNEREFELVAQVEKIDI